MNKLVIAEIEERRKGDMGGGKGLVVEKSSM